MESDNNGGFLKLSRTQEWVSGENAAAPMNRKAIAKVMLRWVHYCQIKFLSVSLTHACYGTGIAG
jgi:hypothetical protein